MTYRVGVLGATGAVGSTILGCLPSGTFPVSEFVPLASGRSAGKRIPFGAGEVEVVEVSDEAIQGLDIVLSSAGGTVSAEWAPKIVEAGAVVVDNTSYWRMHPDVPLVVAEVNPDAASEPLRPDREPELHDDADDGRARADPARDRDRSSGRLDLSVGLGHGPEGHRGAARPSRGRSSTAARPKLSVYPHPIAFNVIPQVETFKDGDDYTTEERKVMAETSKILGVSSDELRVSATCARVPVVTGHSVSANVETSKDLSPEECRELLAGAPGVDRHGLARGRRLSARDRRRWADEVLVGRIRRDPSHDRCLNMWIVGDNLRKGAATNAVQVAELLAERDLVPRAGRRSIARLTAPAA